MSMTPLSTAAADDPSGYLARLKALQKADAERFEAARTAEAQRLELIEEIVNKYELLTKKHEDLISDHDNMRFLNRHLQQEKREIEKEVKSLKLSREADPLVGVFIDGDGAKFQEVLVRDGVQGGEKAAYMLENEVRQLLRDYYPGVDTSKWSIVTVVIAALDNLSFAYQRSLGHRPEFSGLAFTAALRQFVVGFNRGGRHTSYFVDVGGSKDLKELTDTKLKETFTMLLPKCKHVFFAGCHDSGYVSFLSPHKHEPTISPKITLIETYNTKPGYHDLGFKLTSFPEIFRQEDFVHPSVDASPNVARTQTPSIGTKSPASATSTVAGASVGGGSSWAAVGQDAAGQTIDIAPTKKTAKKAPFYLVNRDGERIDEPLPPHGAAAAQAFDQRVKRQRMNFCNTCNLVSPELCSQTNPTHRHGNAKLPREELLVLRHKARNILCKFEASCWDPLCPLSHHCRYGKSCSQQYECRWASTHHMDIRPYQKVYEDGSTELV